MAQDSSIEWTDATWNPVAGCTPVSDGCTNCYAARMAWRLAGMPNGVGAKYEGTAKRRPTGVAVFTGRVRLDASTLGVPQRWRRPRRVFVNSMSDLFHPHIPQSFIQEVFQVMAECSRHTFQVLTKRPERALEMGRDLPWPANVWLGTSVEHRGVLQRIRFLKSVPAEVRFLSCEPLLGPLHRLPLAGIHWIIVGGESGPGARPMHESWVVDIRDQCVRRGIPFFFKQWGGINKKAAGRELQGRTWDAQPVTLGALRDGEP